MNPKHKFRFFGNRIEGNFWRIDSAEAHHIFNVLKLKGSNEIELTNGKGLWITAQVEDIDKKNLKVTGRTSGEVAKSSPNFSLCIPFLKKKSIDDILPTLCELGLTTLEIILLHDTKKSYNDQKTPARWQQILINSVKQCKSNWLPEIRVHDSLASCLETIGPSKVILSDPKANLSLVDCLPSGTEPTYIFVGPERGFNSSELELFGGKSLSTCKLSPNILRSKTAALCVAAALGQLSLSGKNKAL